MQPEYRRSELDALAKFYSLDESHTETLLELADARPSRAEGIQFLAICLRVGGVLSLAAGVVFFVAANWSKFAIFGRFALIELVLVVCIAVALLKPPPQFIGRAAAFLAFVSTGALLALFGQTYQTGADVYELFLTWALLGLPIVVAAQWSVATVAWVVVLDTALLLFCGWHPTGGVLWYLFSGEHFKPTHLELIAAFLNIALWFALELKPIGAAPQWVRNAVLSFAFGFGTWAGIMGVLGDLAGFERHAADLMVLLGLAATMAIVSAYALRRRRDIYPLAVVMGTFIVVSLVWLAHSIEFQDEGMFLLMALWLIGTSTAAGAILTSLARTWRAQAET